MEMDGLRGELERLFELEELMDISSSLLGFQPDLVGGTAAKASYVRALTEYCERRGAVEALCDAVLAARPDAAEEIHAGRNSGLSSAQELAPGDTIGPFTIESELAEGAQGMCFVASRGQSRYRIKVLHPESLRDARGAHRFLTYNRMLSKISGRGLPPVFAVGREQGKVYITHTLLVGEPLSERLETNGPMPQGELIPLCLRIAESLADLHEQGMCHGNLKLENVIVGDAAAESHTGGGFEVQIQDAGADLLRSRRPPNGRATLLSLSSPKTIAPEQLQGAPRSAAGDIYSLGVVLFELATGSAPFEGDSAMDLAVSHLTERPRAPRELAPSGWLSEGLSDFILRLLSKEPEGRPQSGRELLEEIELISKTLQRDAPATREELKHLKAALVADPASESANLALEAAAFGEQRAEAYSAFATAADAVRGESKEADDLRYSLLLRAARGLRSCGQLEASEQAYAKLVELRPNAEPLWEALDALRARQEKYELLVESLLARLESTTSSNARARLMTRIGELYTTELDDDPQAAIAFAQALSEDPTQTGLVRRIEQVAKTNDAIWSEILDTCNEASSDEERPKEERILLLLQLAKWYTNRQRRPEVALPCLQTVLQLAPHHEGALRGMAEVYRANGMWTELGDLLMRRADVSLTPSDARELRAEAANILQTRLDDTDRAQELYERILTEDPADLVVSRALGRIYETKNEVEKLVWLLERQVEDEHGKARHAALCRLGDLTRDKLGDLGRARRYFEAVLDENPRDSTAREGLCATLIRGGQYEELLQQLRRQLDQASSPKDKVEILERIATVCDEELLLHDDAVGALEQALELSPGKRSVLERLGRLYRRLERWQELATLYGTQANQTDEDLARVELLVQRARALANHVGDLNEAIRCYQQVISVQPARADVLEAIADLHEANDRPDEAVEALARLLELTEDPAKKLRLCQRAARLLEGSASREEALSWYRRMLDIEPGNDKALASLRRHYEENGDAAGLLDVLRADLQRTEGARAKSRLSARIAQVELTKENNPDAAKQAALQALQWDPSNLEAAVLLGDVEFDLGNYAAAAEYFEELSTRIDALPTDEAVRVLRRLGQARTRADIPQPNGGLELAEAMLTLLPNDPQALADAAAACFEHGSPERSVELHTRLLSEDAAPSNLRESGELRFRLGESLRRAGDFETALPHLLAAMDVMDRPEEAGRALCLLYEAEGDWAELVQLQSRMLPSVSPQERTELLIQMGETALSHLQDSDRALASFTAALEESPNDRRILSRLMQLYSQEENWGALVSVVEKLAGFVEDAQQKAKYLMTAAKVSARHLREKHQAIDFYRQVLELDPHHPKALSECVVLQIESGDTSGAEDALQAQLARARSAESTSEQLEMLDALFALYHRVPEKLDQAVAVVEEAKRLNPDDPLHEERLSELYPQNAQKYIDRAIPLTLQQLRRRPDNGAAYRRLRQMYTDTRQADPAWCLCQVLELLKLAEPEETRFFQRHASTQAAPAQAAFTTMDWRDCLIHPMVDDRLTQIFGLIEPAMIAARNQPFEELGYDPRVAVELSEHPLPLPSALYFAASVLQIGPPPTFENHREQGALLFLNSQPPSIVIGRSALRSDINPQMAVFAAARHLTNYRSGFHVRHLVSSIPVLKAWLFAALKSCSPNFPIAPELEGPVHEARTALEVHLPPPSRDRLIELVSHLLQTSPSIDLKDWVTGVDLTADRVGFVLANSLKSVTDILKTIVDTTSPPRERRLQELILFAISEPFFEIRRRLGIAIESSP